MAVATSPRMFSGTSSNISIMADGILIADAFCGKVTKGDGWKCAMVSQREGRGEGSLRSLRSLGALRNLRSIISR